MSFQSHKISYYIKTFGCQMNVYDSNLIGTILEQSGVKKAPTLEDANVIIVNTCAVRGGAEDRAKSRIASLKHHKKKQPGLKIAVVGCMAQNLGKSIQAELSHVDFVIGPDNYQKIPQLLQIPEDMSLSLEQSGENYSGIIAKLDNNISTHIAIMRGCNQRCAYCIVPFVRGKERSRAPQEIETEIRAAVEQGIKEVTLLGQTVNSYRFNAVNFAGLLNRLNNIDGLRRIRFTSPHPRHCSAAFIEAMASNEKVCPHLHLPVQSGSNKILKKMKRLYTREKYIEIVEKLRKALPNMGLTTDIITGFVGESDKDYEETLSLVREIRFDSAFMFSYSPREGTAAYTEPETLSDIEKGQRLSNLIKIQNTISTEIAQSQVGRSFEIMAEGVSRNDESEWVGKSGCFRKIVFPMQSGIKSGDFLQIRVKERRGLTLAGSAE